MYSFQFLPVLFGFFRSTTAIPQKFDRLSDENISPSKVSFDFNVENSNHSSLDYGSISSPNIIARAIQASVCPRCPSDSGCANGWHCYMSQGDTACVIPTALLYCSEGYKAVACGPADTVTTSPWPQDGAKLACLNPGNMFCPTYKTYCSQAKNEWCCGASCGVDGDSCCWNTQTQSEYLCKSGTKCGNNACAPIPTQTAELNAWTAQGCYTDSEKARSLPNSYTGADVKIGVCATKAAGFKYFAVEYGVECYWGNELAATSTKGDTSKCDMGCSGFPTAQCGGAGYMNLYLNGDYKPPVPTVIAGVGNFKSIGCMSDPVTPRILSGGSFTDYSGLTVAACIAKAGTAVKYAAVEYWGECYWGNTLASTQSGTCDTPCAGDNNQNCGGSGSAQVYENTAYVAPKPTTTSTTASKTTSTAISITTTSAVSSPTLVPSTGNFKSVGCYTDSAAPRLLSVGSFVDNSGMTVAACAAKAGSSKYFAVEYAVECYWGNELSSTQTSENCNMACAGAATQLCGGGNAATVYQNSNFDEPPTSVPTVLPSSGNWQSSGCYVDSSNLRLLQKGSSTDGALTVAKCIAKAGYVRYIAVEYGSECYWGSVLSSGQKSSACTVACSGESSQLCGGAYAANVYENTEWRPPLSKQEIIDAIREISDYLSTLYESLAALKNAAQAPTRRSIIRKRQEDLEALLTGVQNRARTLSSLFKRRVPQVQEAFELQVIDSSISDPFIAQQAAFESAFAEIMSLAPVALPIAEALALATAAYTAVNVARDIFDSLLKLLTPSDNPPTVTDHPTQETPNPEPTKTSTTTSSSTTSSANACDIFAAVATAPPMVPLKRSLPEDELPDQELSHSALKKRYSTGKLGNYGIAYGKFQPRVDFCQQNNDFHFFAPKYPSTSRLSTGTAQPDNGNEKADDLEQDDRNSADTSRSAPDILGIGKIDFGGPYIDMQWDYNVPDWPSDEQITLCRPYIRSFPDRMSCTNDVYYYTSRGNPARGVEHQYDTEHVFEKHIVKDFFYFVFERGWYDCAGLNRIFGTANNGENAAKQMMAQMAWYDPIHPDYPDSRLGELFVLERGLNLFKGAIMNGRPLTESERQHNVLPRPQTGYAETIQSLESAKLVMEYLSKEPVSLAFTNARDRIHRFLASPEFTSFNEIAVPGTDLTWAALWDGWMMTWLDKRQSDLQSWRLEIKVILQAYPNLPGSWQINFDATFEDFYPAADFNFPGTWFAIGG